MFQVLRCQVQVPNQKHKYFGFKNFKTVLEYRYLGLKCKYFGLKYQYLKLYSSIGTSLIITKMYS